MYSKFEFNWLNSIQIIAIDFDLFLKNVNLIYFHRPRQKHRIATAFPWYCLQYISERNLSWSRHSLYLWKNEGKKRNVSTYRVGWFPRSFFYTLPLYCNSLLYRQFTVRARYVHRNQFFTGFQKWVKSRTKTLFFTKR